MTGYEHYLEAENALRIIASGEAAGETREDIAAVIALAQVHATLAATAAINEQHPAGAWTAVR